MTDEVAADEDPKPVYVTRSTPQGRNIIADLFLEQDYEDKGELK